MPINTPQGLRGLKGLGELSKAQYDNFITKNKELISKHGYDPVYINNLYSNKLFIDKYGIDNFKAIPNLEMRNKLYKEDVVNTEFDKLYSPFNAQGKRNNKKGLGTDYEKYRQLSTDAKLKLMESGYLAQDEFEKNWQKRAGNSWWKSVTSLPSAFSKGEGWSEVVRLFTPGGEEAAKKMTLDKNQKIIDKIYNDDVDTAASRFGTQISETYLNDPYIAGMSDKQVKQAFIQAINGNSSKGDLGIPEFAAHYGNGSGDQISPEMQNFSIDDMRQTLAKKKVYDANMSPDMAMTALNNDAKRYIKDHQGSFRRFGLFARDLGISALSYSADKVNGIYNLGLMAADKMGEKPVVWVDDRGNVLDPNKTKLTKDRKGNTIYKGEDGQMHYVHRQQVDRTTLHNMGKNFDGSDDDGILNPLYWTRAEQFGTLDENEQKQYEKLGVSPYKVAYNPNEDSDIWYEAFKMASFGLADAASMLIPFGIGAAGRVLSTASKVGKVARGLGKALDYTGKALTFETKAGQVAQGTAGALGIAYAYNRGAFQETLAQNLAKAEEAAITASQNDIFNQYNSDKQYKAGVDKLINARAVTMKANYLAQMQKDGSMKPADMTAIDKMIHAKAQDAVLGELVQNKVKERMASKEYTDLQQKAIDGAGDAALNVFLTEGVKYSLVNSLGHRKFLYTNPAGLTKKMSSSLKGLKEVTTSAGKKRMTTETSKFLTRGDKWKQFGKTLASQAWGGAWTNGTDDMQVDAAERINEDSFNRYLNAYQNGEALADTYGFADGIYSYIKGLQNSLGQETTWDAAAVGGLGSVVNFTPNFANIARLATKEGREAYKNNFRREIERDENGIPLKNEDGTVKYKDHGKWHDWRGQANYFIQNGVLNNYYGKKQSERELQSHADYVNNLLDEYNDFKDIEGLVASNIASENVENPGDLKTIQFIKALHSINTLNKLGENSKDPTTMSSVVQNAKTLIEKASKLNEEGNDTFSEEEISNLLSQYYASNPGLEQSDANSQKALYTIAQNAQKLQEASEAFDRAEKEIQKIEKNRKAAIDPEVRTKMKIQQALNGHWIERRDKMQEEIGDGSSSDTTMDVGTMLSTIGGRKNAESLITVYDKQKGELKKELEEQTKKSESFLDDLNEAITEYNDAKDKEDSTATLEAEKKQKEAKAKYEASKEQENYLNDLIARTNDKRSKLAEALRQPVGIVHEDGTTEDLHTTERTLTADEIFALDPVTRARMMREENRKLYSKEQISEIEKLEKRLLMKDADALQKVQDIALLTQRIDANQDAYARIAKNPEAAAVTLETQRVLAADAAYKLINQRNAEQVVSYINEFDEGMKIHSDIDEDTKNHFVFKSLRKLSPTILDIIDKDSLLPQYQKQVTDAKEWNKVVNDIDAVVTQSGKDETWQENVLNNIHNIVENANTKEEVMANLEKVIDDVKEGNAASDFEFILNGLENQGYQRDTTILENRKQRKERETAEKTKKEEAQKKAVEEAKAAAEEKAAEEGINKKDVNMVSATPFNLDDEAAPIEEEKEEQSQSKQESKQEEKKEEKKAKREVIVPHSMKSITTQLQDKTSSWEHYRDDTQREDHGVTYTTGISYQSVLEPSINFAVEAGVLSKKYNKYLNKDRANSIATEDLQEVIDEFKSLGINNPSELISYVNDNGSIVEKIFEQPLTVSPTDYEVITDEQESKKNTDFIANSVEKKDGDWYFVGTFAGDNNNTQVKVSKNFDLGKVIERQQAERKSELAAEGIDVKNPNILDNGDSVQGKSLNIEEQANEITSEGKEVHVSDINTDVTNLNSTGEYNIENGVTTLSGNAMSEYKPDVLASEGRLEHKKGKEENDSMNQYYAWMSNAGIKLQNIIDHELARIIQKNPHAKVKFMMVTPKSNATNDRSMDRSLMLVLDYDNTINKGITAIHNNANGGVIEVKGKKYLVIGTAGYRGTNFEQRELWYKICNKNTHVSPYRDLGLIIPARAKFLKENPNERFYVNDEITTEIVPYSQIPGYIVRQTESDKGVEHRSIKELLADEERNSMHYTFNDLAWGIQELTQFLVVGASLDNVMVPRNVIRNSGSAFVLMPASNGKLIPSYLKPLKYTEMKDGDLKNKVNGLLQSVVSPNYKTRYDAVMELSNVFYFDKDHDFILLSKNKPVVSLTHDGRVFKTFVLNSNFGREEFMKAIEEMNPRVNVTAKVLRSEELLNQYDEAGALMTDAAMFGTAGSSYSIYALDGDGKMIKSGSPGNNTPKSSSSDFKNGDRSQVVFKHDYYTYQESDGNFYLKGKLVTDEREVKQLQYNKRVIDGELIPATSKGVFDYYILSAGEHLEIIMINRNTKEVKEMLEEQAKELIDKLEKEKAEKARDERAAKEVSIENVELLDNKKEETFIDEAETFKVNPNTGELIQEENLAEQITNKTSGETSAESSTVPKDIAHTETEVPRGEGSKPTQSFLELFNNRNYKRRLNTLIRKKWSDVPSRVNELEKFLRDKNIEVDSIGTSKEDIESWIKTIEDCR